MQPPTGEDGAPIAQSGKFEEHAREARGCLFQDLFEGGRAEIQKPHTQNFATTHTLFLAPGGPQGPSSYDFGATYATQAMFLRAGVSHNGAVQATARIEQSSRLATLLRAQIQEGMGMLMIEPEYKGQSFVAGGSIRRQSQSMQAGMGGAVESMKIWQYSMGWNQSFNFCKAFTAGASVQGCINLPNGQSQSSLEAGFRYHHQVPKVQQAETGGNNFVICGGVSSDLALSASYAHQVVESDKSKIWLATDLRLKPSSQDFKVFQAGQGQVATASVGYQIDMRQSSLKGFIDSTGKVSTTVEERLNPAISLLVSAELDHAKEDYKFGFGMNVGGGM